MILLVDKVSLHKFFDLLKNVFSMTWFSIYWRHKIGSFPRQEKKPLNWKDIKMELKWNGNEMEKKYWYEIKNTLLYLSNRKI